MFRKSVKRSDIYYAKNTTEKRVIIFYQEIFPKRSDTIIVHFQNYHPKHGLKIRHEKLQQNTVFFYQENTHKIRQERYTGKFLENSRPENTPENS